MDPESYAEPVAAYKQYIVDVARVMTREAGENVPDSVLVQRAEDIFTLEKTFAGVSRVVFVVRECTLIKYLYICFSLEIRAR